MNNHPPCSTGSVSYLSVELMLSSRVPVTLFFVSIRGIRKMNCFEAVAVPEDRFGARLDKMSLASPKRGLHRRSSPIIVLEVAICTSVEQ